MLERLLYLAAVGYVYIMVTAAVTVFQRFCRVGIVLHGQEARRYRASANSCRERAATVDRAVHGRT